ncbi:putative permease [Metallosphaera yellowstonensis MK1]|uniref:Probable membrane transporter protein n=1 Tax=Metallosphaera yellowstonensis MK1 TaxID=671065 RepID=H2C161_9CREN|nr:sulfite exporter TauE/SafE family protein [Metallosphaera yellowstonensis]EHP71157.1 putative permease [Metallosphaera yellowstonensis MK1]
MNSIILSIIFILTWILSALFAVAGVGAANTLIPIYYSLGIPFSIAAAAGLLLNVFSLSSATVNNGKRGRVLWKLGTIFIIPAVIMAPIGAFIGIHTPRKILLWIFVAFLGYTLYNLIRGRAKEETNKFSGNIKGYILGITVGAIAGFLGGLLGVGGGMIILPVLALIEKDYKKVSATAGYVALFSSASGFTSYLFLLRGISYDLWLVILIGGILGGFSGSYLMNKMKTLYVKYTIVSIITFVLIKILIGII